MEELSQTIQSGIAIVLAVGLVVALLLVFFCPARRRSITVVKKRKTEYRGLNNMRSRLTTVPHYTIDCTYAGSDKIHTLRCNSSTYNALKTGKTYTVTVRLMELQRVEGMS